MKRYQAKFCVYTSWHSRCILHVPTTSALRRGVPTASCKRSKAKAEGAVGQVSLGTGSQNTDTLSCSRFLKEVDSGQVRDVRGTGRIGEEEGSQVGYVVGGGRAGLG